jgi:phage shock protein C
MDPQMGPRRLYRSADDRILAGVAGGLAAYFDVDPVIVRIIWFLSVFFTGSLTFWVYLIMIVVVPPEPIDWAPQAPWPGAGSSSFQAVYTPPPADAGGTSTSPSGSADPTASGAAPGSAPAFDANATPGTGVPPAPAQPQGWGWGWGGDDWRWQRRQERWQRRAERWQQRQADGHYHRDRGGPGLVFGLLLILGGGMLAWHQIDPRFDLGLTWPVLVIVVGVILVASSIRAKD